MAERSSAEEIVLSEERRAVLAPKLLALLDDLRHLAELEMSDVEPAVTPWAGSEETDESR